MFAVIKIKYNKGTLNIVTTVNASHRLDMTIITFAEYLNVYIERMKSFRLDVEVLQISNQTQCLDGSEAAEKQRAKDMINLAEHILKLD